MIVLSPISAQNLDEAFNISAQAFGISGHLQSVPQKVFTELFYASPDNWTMLLVNHNPAALVAVMDYPDFIYVGYMVVLPSHQRQGLGKLLMESIIEKYASKKNILLDASVKGFSLYEKIGFKIVDRAFIFSLDRLGILQNCPDSEITIEEMRIHHLIEIRVLDQKIFGTERFPIIEHFLKLFSDRAFVSINRKQQITGYFIAQWNALGPFVAIDIASAQQLLQKASVLSFSGTPTVIIPEKNVTGSNLLATVGRQVRHCTHMAYNGST